MKVLLPLLVSLSLSLSSLILVSAINHRHQASVAEHHQEFTLIDGSASKDSLINWTAIINSPVKLGNRALITVQRVSK